MLTVDEALNRILEPLAPLGVEDCPLAEAAGRVLAEPVRAGADQPPLDVSAMDGFAVRADDLARLPARLAVVATIPAGGRSARAIGPGEAARIFTGAPLPPGADTIVIQEDAELSEDGEQMRVILRQAAAPGKHIRRAGLDFRKDDVVLSAGTRLGPRALALAAAADCPQLSVRARPRVALIATGDELRHPGAPRRPQDIISSTSPALAAAIAAWGGVPHDLGIVPDDKEALKGALRDAALLDFVVTLGGASVGAADLVRQTLAEEGFTLAFWKIAMRPGKPLLYGRLGETPVLGLPGNPVSALVCALLFLKPAIEAQLGLPPAPPELRRARLLEALPANGPRADYMRARLETADGLAVRPFPVQDSSMLSSLAAADALLVRPAGDPARQPGDTVDVLPLGGLL